ncbi:unnamed protein product, partial [Dibothriocephalus latus]
GRINFVSGHSAFVINPADGHRILISSRAINRALPNDIVAVKVNDLKDWRLSACRSVSPQVRASLENGSEDDPSASTPSKPTQIIPTEVEEYSEDGAEALPAAEVPASEQEEETRRDFHPMPSAFLDSDVESSDYIMVPNALSKSNGTTHPCRVCYLIPERSYQPKVKLATSSVPEEEEFTIPQYEYVRRRDFRSNCIVSVDPATAKDVDDALHVRKCGPNTFEVGVHIADVSFFVRPNSALDREAADRTTSVYLVQRVIPMLPSILSEQLCSLNPGADRLAFSVVFKVDSEAQVFDVWFGRSIIRSCAKLSYENAQRLLESSDDGLESLRSSVNVHGPFSLGNIKRSLYYLNMGFLLL